MAKLKENTICYGFGFELFKKETEIHKNEVGHPALKSHAV